MIIFRRYIPHQNQPYNTCGFWEFASDDKLFIDVSQLSDDNLNRKLMMWLVAIHEQLEAELCHFAGIDQDDVTAFDIAYEECRRLGLKRAPCGCLIDDEPGSDVHCPCFEQHEMASDIERMLARMLNIDWDEYEAEIEKL